MLVRLIIFLVTVLDLDINKRTGKIGNNCTKPVKIMVAFKCSSNFWKTLEIPLINCEIVSF